MSLDYLTLCEGLGLGLGKFLKSWSWSWKKVLFTSLIVGNLFGFLWGPAAMLLWASVVIEETQNRSDRSCNVNCIDWDGDGSWAWQAWSLLTCVAWKRRTSSKLLCMNLLLHLTVIVSLSRQWVDTTCTLNKIGHRYWLSTNYHIVTLVRFTHSLVCWREDEMGE